MPLILLILYLFIFWIPGGKLRCLYIKVTRETESEMKGRGGVALELW